jgi:hypothetical protein
MELVGWLVGWLVSWPTFLVIHVLSWGINYVDGD